MQNLVSHTNVYVQVSKVAIRICFMEVDLPFNSYEYVSNFRTSPFEISRNKKILICKVDSITHYDTYSEALNAKIMSM